MSRRHWESLRSFIQVVADSSAGDPQTSSPRTLAVLPGALAVETAAGYIALGRRSAGEASTASS
jgi:hypothetical protein